METAINKPTIAQMVWLKLLQTKRLTDLRGESLATLIQ